MLLQAMKLLLVQKTFFFFLIREYSLLLWEISYLILVVIQEGSRLLQILISCGI